MLKITGAAVVVAAAAAEIGADCGGGSRAGGL